MNNKKDIFLLAGFALAHAAWSVSDLPDSELLVPFALVEWHGHRELFRFEANTQEEAISEGKKAVAEAADLNAWAFAREGAWRARSSNQPQDVLVVDFWALGMLNPMGLVQAFARYTVCGRFRIVGEMIMTAGREMIDEAAASEMSAKIKEGIGEHPQVAELWGKWV